MRTLLLFLLTFSFVHAAHAKEISSSTLAKIEDTLGTSEISELASRSLSAKELPVAAAKLYRELNKTWGPDYPPTAYAVQIDGIDLIVISESNDGGAELDVYTPQGVAVASASCGESSSWRWSN